MNRSRMERLRQAIRQHPGDPEPLYDLGNLLLDSAQPEAALEPLQHALRLAPGHPQILLQLGNALAELSRFAEAVSCFRQALHSDPAQADAHYNLGNALREMGHLQEAAGAYRESIRLAPHNADACNNLGNVLREMGQLEQAIACYREALRINPRLHHARAHLVHQCQHICDWTQLDVQTAEIRRLVREEPQALIPPFAFLALSGTTAAEQRLCADHWVQNRLGGVRPKTAVPMERGQQDRIHIGYLAADFRQHPLTWLACELMELHDRQQFSVSGYSYGADDGTPERQRWERAFDRFVDIRELSMQQAAARIETDRVDILVDLSGFTQNSRSGILALRPAPILVNWLGFPGTMGADASGRPLADYLITDRWITPPEQSGDYAEQLVFLPDTYQPNNRIRPVARIPSRAECGLPQHGVVFCCFNQTFKITPQLFDLWIELVNDTPRSVLWLLECNRWAKANLLQAAHLRGVAAERLIFAPRVPMEQHLARHRCADLMLDTLPYNAHTTTSDALWMGLPLLTCCGDTFASRVAASLLHAAGLPQLVTNTLKAYGERARELAAQPSTLRAMRAELDERRESLPLFDTPRFTRHLEAAYRAMRPGS